MGAAHPAPGRAPRRRARQDERWRGHRGRAVHRHAHRRLRLCARESCAACDRRRADDVQVSHALRRQELRRPGDGLARGAAAARHGNGAVPPYRAARRRAHADDRHGARRRAARRGRLPAERRQGALHDALRPQGRARNPRHRLARHAVRDPQGRDQPARRPLHLDGAPRAGARGERIQGHGRALRRLRLRSRRRAGRGGADRALHDGGRRIRRRLPHRAGRAVRCRRGFGRRARREPPRRQRRGELHRVRRRRGRLDGCLAAQGRRSARAGQRGDRICRRSLRDAIQEPSCQVKSGTPAREAVRDDVAKGRHPPRRRGPGAGAARAWVLE